jgi:hypothetical protein
MALVSFLGLGVVGVLLVVFGLAMAYPNLPALDTLTDYKPKMPLRIFTSDSVLIGEFGEERRNMVHIKDIPDVMKKPCWPSRMTASMNTAASITGHHPRGPAQPDGRRQARRVDHHAASGAQLLPVQRTDAETQGL